jgi:Cu-Zn family superoxide dismutase
MPNRNLCSVLTALILTTVAISARAQEATPNAQLVATEDSPLFDTEGENVGSATLSERDDGTVEVVVNVEQLPPGEHGIHIHETGVCDSGGDEPFGSAGGHFNPTGVSHGAPPDSGTPESNRGHAGDLGNITVGDDGTARLSIGTDRFTLSPGPSSLLDEDGSAIVVHADADDLTTDPSGNSGARIVCGVITEPLLGGSPVAQWQVSVGLDEYFIVMDSVLKPGATTFVVTNRGRMSHGFAIEGPDVSRSLAEPLQPGETRTITLDLVPGDYFAFCPIGDHRQLGMQEAFAVSDAG